MKAITVREPWATLIAIQAKTIETRSWKAPDWLIGQRIAIHAAKGLTTEEADFIWSSDALKELIACRINPRTGLPCAERNDLTDEQIVSHYRWNLPIEPASRFFTETRGKVIATAVLANCVQFDQSNVRSIVVGSGAGVTELAFGDFKPGRYGWLLRDVQRLLEPIPVRGELGVWTWDAPKGLVAA